MRNDLKIALIHDFLVQYGGAERVLEALAEMFPDAPIYTLLYNPEKMRGKFQGKEIHTSFLQKFPKFLRKRYKLLLPLMPTAPETFDLRDFDLVISSSGAWSKGIVTRLNTTHISYVHSPMRFVWDYNERYRAQIQNPKSKIQSFFTRLFLNYIRLWDKLAADRPDYLIANSKYTQQRIKKYYGRESVVIYPPVETSPSPLTPLPNQGEGESKKDFLIVSRLSPYKNIDKVVEAFNKLGLPLVVIGDGQQKKNLQKIAAVNVKILGWQSDEEIKKYYQNARAFIFAGIDDFGMTPVEAMSFGVPVLALRDGGVLETVIEGQTGEFFDAATPEVIADGVRRLVENEKKYDKQGIINQANKFNKERFIKELEEYINKNL